MGVPCVEIPGWVGNVMSKPYRCLTAAQLRALGDLEGFAMPEWTGPGLPGPASPATVQEVFDVLGRMLARGQSLVQAQDGLSEVFTVNGITAPAERFLLGPAAHVERAAAFRALFMATQQRIDEDGLASGLERHLFPDLESVATMIGRWLPSRLFHAARPPDTAKQGDATAFAFDSADQFAMGWTTLEDVFRRAYPRLGGFVQAVTDSASATAQFWPLLRETALPYNLLVLQRLSNATAERYRVNFGSVWTSEFDAMLGRGVLYGIDMTIFSGMSPARQANGTTRFTPCTMTILEMTADGDLNPIAVYVADPEDAMRAETYLPTSRSWIYGLLAAKTSMTVFGIWLGHVYPLHIVTAAMQMAMWNTLPDDHLLHQALAPQSRFTISFNFLLLTGWSQLSPPTSIGDTGKFLKLAAKYAQAHDFFATDPHVMLASMGIEEASFTSPGGEPWDRYPNVQHMLHLWDLTARYVQGVIDAGYASDADVAHDRHVAAWMAEAGAHDGGNVAGLPRVSTKAALAQVVTSLLYRIVFHGMGRLRSIGNPEPSFAPNFPPCLQSTRIPASGEATGTETLLREFLPKTGTVGALVTFYDIFSFTAPAVPLVPNKGAEHGLLFDERFPAANESLVAFRRGIEAIVRDRQPDWVEIGQWPANIEF